MACQFDELYLDFNQDFINLIKNRFVSIFRVHHWKFLCLLMVLRLLSNKVTDCTILFLHEKLKGPYSVFVIGYFALEGNFFLDKVGESYLLICH